MRIVVFGYSAIGHRALQTLLGEPDDVTGVVTHADAPGEHRWFPSVAELARRSAIPCLEVPAEPLREETETFERVDTLLRSAEPDLILSASFRALLPRSLLTHARIAALNLHGSLLPRYRGRAPLNWVLVRGERETGMTLHHMTDMADAGDIVGQIRLPIGEDETAPELSRRLEDAAAELLTRLLPRIRTGEAPRIPQDPAQATVVGRRRPADGRFEWSWPARRIHDLVRAVTRPFPGAFCLDPERLTVWRTRCLSPPEAAALPSLEPGERLTLEDGRRVVGTGEGLLELLDASEGEVPV